MSGAGAVVSLVLLEWTVGWIGAAAWTQSWRVVKRGHFRIIAWGALIMALLALITMRAALEDVSDPGPALLAVAAFAVGAALFTAAQYSKIERRGTVAGALSGGLGLVALIFTAALVPQWPGPAAVAELVSGALLLGAVTNGMLLGHWYLNQPGLKPWALARLTFLALVASLVSVMLGVVFAGRLSAAATSGAALGLPGFGESLGRAFYVIWLLLVTFTGVVLWMARRCVLIRSIQSATGLFYVALLTAGVAEFLVRYLMVNAS